MPPTLPLFSFGVGVGVAPAGGPAPPGVGVGVAPAGWPAFAGVGVGVAAVTGVVGAQRTQKTFILSCLPASPSQNSL